MNHKQKVIEAIKRRVKLNDDLRNRRKTIKSLETASLNADIELARQIKNVMGGRPVLFDGWQYSIDGDGHLHASESEVTVLDDAK